MRGRTKTIICFGRLSYVVFVLSSWKKFLEVLYCVVLHWLNCIAMYYFAFALYCFQVDCIAQYCFILYCIALSVQCCIVLVLLPFVSLCVWFSWLTDWLNKLYFSTIKMLAQRPTHISAVVTVLLITKTFIVKYDRKI